MDSIISNLPAKSPPRKAKARPALHPEAVCEICKREKAIFWRRRAWCVHCESAQLFPDEAIAAHQARTGQITREVGK